MVFEGGFPVHLLTFIEISVSMCMQFMNDEFNICGSELYSSEISPTRCNNCVLFFAVALLYMFRATISPIIRSTYDVYGHR